ncbi:MAG: phosphoribosylamine--glycine ligase [Phycisphaeraceae bacterium]|nr:phosphoribosylamine--glycine ligase [Phycisphaeraceae bacterium]
MTKRPAARSKNKEKLNVLLVGGGGREHALAWKMSRSPSLGTLYATHTDNPGIAAHAKPTDCPYELGNWDRLKRFCDREAIDLVVVGPEADLARGIGDALRTKDRAVLGPDADGARLESSKSWAKQLMRAASIPTAEGRVFRTAESAIEYIESRTEPVVVKASGLAAGKGVIVCDTNEQATAAVRRIMHERAFGAAGDEVIVEERLSGAEVSILALTDGRSVYVLDTCQDHKRLLDGGEGPNTGGMGAYSPAPVLSDQQLAEVHRLVLIPAIDALRRDDIDFRGVLYAGLMLTHGGPKVLEFNVRFGDPECQTLLPRMKCDLVDVLRATATGRLEEATIGWDPRVSVCVVLASEGYPDKPITGRPITGLAEAQGLNDVHVFHAGVRRSAGGGYETAGGRVLNVVALGDTLDEARAKADEACDMIRFEGMQRRHDIGAAAIAGRRA